MLRDSANGQKSKLRLIKINYRGKGEPLMGFWPYFLHEYSSAGISAVFELVAGTLIVFFTLNFLFINFNIFRFFF